jgi:hypothetical protein
MPEGILRGTSTVPCHALEIAGLTNELVLERLEDMMVLEYSATNKHAATMKASYGGQKQKPRPLGGDHLLLSAIRHFFRSF